MISVVIQPLWLQGTLLPSQKKAELPFLSLIHMHPVILCASRVMASKVGEIHYEQFAMTACVCWDLTFLCCAFFSAQTLLDRKNVSKR